MIKLSINFSINLSGKSWQLFRRKKRHSDFFLEVGKTIDRMAGARAKSTIDNYRTALHSFQSYLETVQSSSKSREQLSASSLTMEGYQRWLTEKGVSPNSVSCYMRSLRALFKGLLPEADVNELFKNVFTGKERTEKRSIPIEDICKLQELQLPARSSLAWARDMFLFSFYALGIPFVDMAFLQKSQVKDGYMVYHRHKTGQRVCIKIEPPMQAIIRRYQHQDSPYLLPIMDATKNEGTCPGAVDKNTDLQYETVRARYNRYLRRLSLMAHTQRVLTSYVARHSWASTAYHSNVNLAVISKALGHSSPNTTLTYIRSIDDQRIDEANHMLLEKLKMKYKKG